MKKNKAARSKRNMEKENGGRKKTVKEKFTEMLELPKELVLDVPRLTVVGNGDLMIENHKGIMEYGSEAIRISTGAGTVTVTGTGLVLKEITSEDIIISGRMRSIEFV